MTNKLLIHKMKICTDVLQLCNKGFTLIELLVVIAILVVMSGMVVTNYSGEQRSNAQYQVAKHEIEQIRQAIIRFQQDNLIRANRVSAADMSFLFERGSLAGWNKDYELGWRGPYMSGGDSGLVDIGDSLQLSGTGEAHVVASVAHERQRAIPDPFILAPIANGNAKVTTPACSENVTNNMCLFDWRFVGQINSDGPHTKFGRPYLIFDLTNKDRARIVSMGSDGVYDSAAQICNAGGDDIVECIYQ